MKPFSDDGTSIAIGDMTIENGESEVAFFGQLKITADKAGLDRAAKLLEIVTSVHAALASRADLPDIIETVDADAVTTVKNPFEAP